MAATSVLPGSPASRREAALLPQSEDGIGLGAVMALFAHVLLVIALAFGVQWHTAEPEGVTAELWAQVPQIAAPKGETPQPPTPPQPPVEQPKPEPTPKAVEPPKPTQAERDAEIAIEKAKAREQKEKAREEAERQQKLKQQQAEREKAEQDKRDKAKADAEAAQRKKDEDKKLAAMREKLRQEQLQRIMGQAGGTGEPTSTGKAARDAGPSASYGGRLKARIKPNIVTPGNVEGNIKAIAIVYLAPDGRVVSARITKSSGNPLWDDAVIDAILKTEVFPRDVDGRVPSPIELTFTPSE
jgi:colicin import membrane protein